MSCKVVSRQPVSQEMGKGVVDPDFPCQRQTNPYFVYDFFAAAVTNYQELGCLYNTTMSCVLGCYESSRICSPQICYFWPSDYFEL